MNKRERNMWTESIIRGFEETAKFMEDHDRAMARDSCSDHGDIYVDNVPYMHLCSNGVATPNEAREIGIIKVPFDKKRTSEESKRIAEKYNQMTKSIRMGKIAVIDEGVTITPKPVEDVEIPDMPGNAYFSPVNLAEMWYNPSSIGLCSVCGMDDAPIQTNEFMTGATKGTSEAKCKWCLELEYVTFFLKATEPAPIFHLNEQGKSYDVDERIYTALYVLAVALWVVVVLKAVGVF